MDGRCQGRLTIDGRCGRRGMVNVGVGEDGNDIGQASGSLMIKSGAERAGPGGV